MRLIILCDTEWQDFGDISDGPDEMVPLQLVMAGDPLQGKNNQGIQRVDCVTNGAQSRVSVAIDLRYVEQKPMKLQEAFPIGTQVCSGRVMFRKLSSLVPRCVPGV